VKSQRELKIPSHLKNYIVEQDYAKYTSRDHALWRFIMRTMRDFLSQNAHPSFLHGLELTGIPTEQIPRISDMNEKLSQFGWNAVCVRGFIPPLAFLDFQSSCILPIAADMRSLEHFDYTPAPDIVHEAAGHAPILADPDYRAYLARYSAIARKAIFSREDVELYEAIRLLSDVKENPDSTPDVIQRAEENLKTTYNAISWVSEAAEIARMYWWTVEYGLIGSLQHPKIYGAGLLSSLGESRDCLNDQVKKIAFSKTCLETSYDITEPQPQLFVAKDFVQLLNVLEDFEENLAFKKGGETAVKLGKKAETITTTVLDSGLEISGLLEDFVFEKGTPVFIRWKGPVQLCYEGKQLQGQGTARHKEGFSSPLGVWKGLSTSPTQLSDAALVEYGLKKQTNCELNFNSGFKIRGLLRDWTRSQQGDLLLLTWENCTVQRGTTVYFEASWGDFDLAVGSSIPSVYGGPADWDQFGSGNFGKSSSQPGRVSPYTDKENHIFALYSKVRSLRLEFSKIQKHEMLMELEQLCTEFQMSFKNEWLLALEIAELLSRLGVKESETTWFAPMKKQVFDMKQYPSSQRRFIEMGMALAGVR
jgi:phenylalanine-4-hydroxylase